MFNKKIDTFTAEDARNVSQLTIEATKKLALDIYMNNAIQEIRDAIKLHPKMQQVRINLPNATAEMGTAIVLEFQERGFTVEDFREYDSHSYGHSFKVSW